MDLNNKLKGMPHVYYFNLDNRTDRREYMESQFERWGIDYTRVSASKFLASEVDTWRHLVDELHYFPKSGLTNIAVTANSIAHIDFIRNWLETSNDPYLILMEDDYDLNLIEYWHFDWQYLMDNIPYDWDCIQLGFESRSYIKFFLHPKMSQDTFFGPCMITRRYAQKLVDLHYKDGKYFFKKKHGLSKIMEALTVCVDYFMCENGRTYCLPLITTNNDFGSYEENRMRFFAHHALSRDAYYQFWTQKRDFFTLEEFFTYGKPNDLDMTVILTYD